MKHKVSGYKLKRDGGSRKALFRNLVTSVIEHERVITTVPKAKAIQPLVEKMITLAKRDTLHARRQAAAFLETPAAVKKLFDKLGTRFGHHAVYLVKTKQFGQMVALKGNEIVSTPIDVAVGTLKTVDPAFYNMAKTFFG